MGRPPMRASGLPGKRLEAWRAGMTATGRGEDVSAGMAEWGFYPMPDARAAPGEGAALPAAGRVPSFPGHDEEGPAHRRRPAELHEGGPPAPRPPRERPARAAAGAHRAALRREDERRVLHRPRP